MSRTVPLLPHVCLWLAQGKLYCDIFTAERRYKWMGSITMDLEAISWVKWTGFVWLRMQMTDGLLLTLIWTCGELLTENSWVLREGLRYMLSGTCHVGWYHCFGGSNWRSFKIFLSAYQTARRHISEVDNMNIYEWKLRCTSLCRYARLHLIVLCTAVFLRAVL